MNGKRRGKIIYILGFCTVLFFSIHFLTRDQNESCNFEESLFQRQMKGPLSAFDPVLIKEVIQNYLVSPSKNEYNLQLYAPGANAKTYNNYRNYEVWKYLNTTTRVLFPSNNQKGFYVEVGAFDGEYFSNSLFLEMEYGWGGLLIEPDKGLYQSLLGKNRKAWSCHCCLSSNPYPHETVLSIIDSNQGKVSSLHQRIYNSISESRTNKARDYYGTTVYESVQCLPLHTLLLALNRTFVDLIYLDVEDVEVDLLKHFPWDKIDVAVWIVEHRNPKYSFGMDGVDPAFIKWFESMGHVLYEVAPYVLDYIFIKKNSTYYLENRDRLRLKS